MNLIKNNIAKNLNINVKELELSNTYIAFFDKLEKSNSLYENIINLETIDYEILHKEHILDEAVSEGGYFEFFASIINKYGIVPYSYMQDTVESSNYQKIEYLYTEKVKKDILELKRLRENGAVSGVLREYKNKLMQENYNLLSKVFGEPTLYFDFEYRDIDDKFVRFEGLTPLEFKNKFLSLKLENFVAIGNVPMYNKEYKKLYQKKYHESVYGHSRVTYLNLPINELKNLAIKQLKDGIPVYMGAHILKLRDKKSGVLDSRLYNYEETLNLKRLTKEEALNLYDISMHHVMVFTGVNVINEKPIRWKVEDSYGDTEKYKGYYIMNDNFFEEFVFSVIIDKKYLSEEQTNFFNQKAIEYEADDVY